MNIRNLLPVLFFGLASIVNAQETYKIEDGREFKLIREEYPNKYYEEVYEGVRDFDATVITTNGKSIFVNDLTFEYFNPYPQSKGTSGRFLNFKSIKAKIDGAPYIISFKDIDEMTFFWNKMKYWIMDSLKINLKNKKEIKADFFFGYRRIDVKGKVHNEALDKYSTFEKAPHNINSIEFK
ncbi:MAG: hypothetical protein IB618_02225 [Candidatus Pacearchaeota archaeon]|nr:MAG: hypothetical protein IB618_02225 [Candidatus Pacearchaeota archaeon]